MIGILNEKPSQARNFAKALGGRKGTYDGEDFVIVPARGHLYGFKSPETQVPKDLYDKYHIWDMANLPWNESDFAWEYEPLKDTKDILSGIDSVLRGCDEICIATDVDPTGEGQSIAWEVLSELGLTGKRITRMYFVDEAPKSVRAAFKARKPLPARDDDPDWKMASFRAKWDLLSMQWSRVATMCGDGKSVLRQGRLKSFMCRAVGEQIKAHKEFKAKPYYYASFLDDHGVRYVDADGDRFDDKADAAKVVSSLHQSSVTVDSRKMCHTAPRRLIDLASLSSTLAPKGISAKVVLDTYQKLYTAQIVSYPRTEDKCVTPEQFDELLPKVDAIARLVGVDPGILTHRTPRKTHVKSGGAHGANRPGPNVPASLSDLVSYGTGAKEIYDLVARSYLAMLAEDYEYEAQMGHVTDFPSYKGKANVPKSKGWKAVFGDLESVDADEASQGLGSTAKPEVAEGKPKRPQKPTMQWLMKQLEKHDVGTGATRTSTYAEVTNAGTQYPLMSEIRGNIQLTKFGEMSYRLLKDTNIGDVGLTERVQKQMQQVSKGELSEAACLAEVADLVREDMKTMQKNSVTMRTELGVESKVRERCNGVWDGEEVSFSREFCGHRFTDEEVEALLAGKTISFDATSKAGKPFVARGSLGRRQWKGREFVGFSLSDVPGSVAGHRFTDAEIEALEAGRKIHVDDCVSKAGKKFSCDMVLGKDGRVELVFPKVPASWAGYTFTKDERTQLESGLAVDFSDTKPFVGRKGNNFGCKLKLCKLKNGKESLVPDFSDDWQD